MKCILFTVESVKDDLVFARSKATKQSRQYRRRIFSGLLRFARNDGVRAILFLACSFPLHAEIQVYQFDSPQQEQTFYTLTKELRCPKCQNQAIADSDAMIAQDIKARIYTEVREGKTEEEIISELARRYGDFIHYRPSFNASTALLWLGPPLLLVTVVAIALITIARRKNEIESEVMKEEDN